MFVICEPMWKCSSCRQSSMPTARSRSTVATISAVVRPNLERSPVDSTHLPAPLVVEARAHADHRPQVELGGRGQDRVELAHAVHRDHDAPPELLREQRRLDEGAVLVAVAQDERLGVLLQRQRHQQLRLRAGLDPEVEGTAVLDQLLDHVALLVHLDRVDAAVAALVVVLRDRLLERAEQLLDARPQDVGEADQHRQVDPAAAQVVDERLQVDRERAGTGGRDLDVARRR